MLLFFIPQIWVNMPASEKLSEPSIQLIGPGGTSRMPEVVEASKDDERKKIRVKIIMGEFGGFRSALRYMF